jgi:hypothetical protein
MKHGLNLGLMAAAALSRKRANVEQLAPPGDGSAQVLADFVGATTGKTHSGNRLWLPDQVAMPGSPTAWMTARGIAGGATLQYSQVQSCKMLVLHHGIGNNRATNVSDAVNGSLTQIKAAITAGQIDPMVVLWPQGMDPADTNNVDLWGNDAADGSYPFKTMKAVELYPRIPLITVAESGAANRAIMGFSRGGMVTACERAEYDTAIAACFATMGAPRTTGDFTSALAYYNNFSANEKLKCFNNVQNTCTARSPITASGTPPMGLFNQFGNGSAPFRLVKSANDSTTLNSMNQFDTRLTALGITHLFIDLATPTHSLSSYMTADAGATLAWIQQQLAA